MPGLPEKARETLFRVARITIETWLTQRKRVHQTDFLPVDPLLMEERASFVTLTIHGKLRGCVGSIVPYQPLLLDVSQNAFHAAFEDTRFLPLSREEWKLTDIEISLLTVPVEIHVSTWEELLEQLHPGIDGVIINHNGYQATFLPQVWESLPEKHEFMEALCQKAGLSRFAYKTETPRMSFYLYQVEILEETKRPSPQ
ncbi:AmmeMemoRadiSam system protein A [bacterium]|nr:AmmeMemoRadiSam system protein A [bacterium]